MKRYFLFIIVSFAFFSLKAQLNQTYTEMFDSVCAHIDRAEATTGILYDRVVPFADFPRFNSILFSTVDTIHADIFLQCYSELYRAAFVTEARLPFSYHKVKESIVYDTNVVDIGVIHYRFNLMDSAAAMQKLYYNQDSLLLEDTTVTTSLYLEQTAFVASPLRETIFDSTVIFHFRNEYLFDNTQNKIVSMSVDFGDGLGFRSIQGDAIQVHYNDTGTYIMHFIAGLEEGQELLAHAEIKYKKNNAKSPAYRFTEDIQISAQIPFTDYEGNTSCGTGVLRIYYADTISMKLQKPILIADGFDPGNKRQFDIYNGIYDNKKSFWGLLYYDNNTKHMGKILLQKGYDIILLDFPDGGGYIERNAMVCIEAINIINNRLEENESAEQIVVVGPSMGGQVSRYALKYMEDNPNNFTRNGKHNCRLWVSYDSPHQGANISLGAQAFMHFFGYIGEKENAKEIWDNTINCVAAKQMLIKQYSIYVANSTTYSSCSTNILPYLYHPYFLQYYNNINTISYPNNLRKIAITNGSLNGTLNSSGCSDAIELDAYANIRVSKIQLFPTNGTCEIFYGMFAATGWQYFLGNRTKLWVFADSDGNFSIDAAPGGLYNTFEQIADAADDMGEQIQEITTTTKNHCFMPITSTLDIDGNMNYSTNISGRDLVLEGITPFASYTGPINKNMGHVTFDQNIVDYLLNEIETYIIGSRNMELCDESNFEVHIPDNTSATVTWLCSDNLRIISTNNPNVIRIVAVAAGDGWVSAEVSSLTRSYRLANYPVNISAPNNNNVYVVDYQTMSQPSEIWENDVLLPQSFTIESNKVLTISGNVQCATNAIIKIMPGGKLIIDGGNVTNYCNSQMWQGIQLLGNSSTGQLLFGAQGIVELRNGAVISNAVCGIKVWDGINANSSGGIVRAANASFINNATAVEFGEYHNINNGYELGNRSYFTNCIFTINNDYLTNNERFQAHVKLNSIKNVRFAGCIFSNERNALPSVTAERTVSNMGILAFNSGFSVKPSCNVSGVYPCPPEQQNRSSFNGFSHGIYVSGSEGNYTVNIDQTDFGNNVIGINLSATTNASVLRSQFNIGYTDFLPKQTGIIASNSTGFRFEENQFAGNTEFLGTSVGIKIRNSGENSNQTYKNDFSNLTIGEEFIGMNRSKRDLFIGLQALCNNHTDIAQSDILVEMNQNGVYDGIRYYQGGRDDGTMLYLLSAGNLFSNSATTNYDNNTMQYIDYQYSANDPREMPTVNSMVYQDLVTVSNSCLSRIDALTMSQISQQYNTARNSCISLLYNYNQQIDGGNTEQLLDDIQGEWSDDVWKIREELLAKSPYVSREVLKETAEKNLLPQAIYLEICIANVDATRSQEFLDFLRYEIPNPLPEYMLDIIRENWDTKSLRTVLESNLAHYSSKKDNLLDMMLNNSLKDSITNRTYVRSMLTERGYYSDYFTIAEGYIEENDFENAYNTMYDLSLNYYKLTEEQQTEINDFEEYIAFRENLFALDNSNIYQLTASEIAKLVDYTQTHTGRGRILAQNILCVLYDICEEEELLENKDHFTPNTNTYSSAKTTSDQIEVMPNPAQNYTTFKWDFDLLQGNALLKIYEQSGKQIETQVLSSAQGQWVWDTRKVSDGIYTYSVTSNSMLIGSGKVIVKK